MRWPEGGRKRGLEKEQGEDKRDGDGSRNDMSNRREEE